MRTTFKAIITVILCSFTTFVPAQEAVSAHIIDAEAREPIDLVSVVSSVNGTITNREGGFIVRTDSNDYLQISHLSYYPQSISVRQLNDTILLQPRMVELAEFVVMPNDVIVRELKAVWNKYNNLLRGKRDRDLPVQTFYYRQLTQNNDVYVEYIEAFFTAPTSVSARELSLLEGRFATIKQDSVFRGENFFLFSTITPFSLGSLGRRRALNPFLVRDFERYYDVNIARIISPANADEIVVYRFTPYQERPRGNAIMFLGQLYVRTRDRAIVRMEASTQDKSIFRGNLNIANVIYSFTVTYRDGIESYPIVENVQFELQMSHSRDGQLHQLQANSILYAIDQPIETRRSARTIRQNDNLLQQIANSRHNQAFWDNNPFIKRTQVEQRVLDDFNRLGYFGSMNLSE
jgi:hypothetical protein